MVSRKITPYNIFLFFIFFSYIPYLLPQEFFVYTKVYSVLKHTVVTAVLFLVGMAAIELGKRVNGSKTKKYAVIFSENFFYKECKFFLIISILFNFLYAFYFYYYGIKESAEFDLISAKTELTGFSGFAFLTQLYLFFMPFYIKYSIRNKKGWKLLIAVLGLSVTLRAFFHSERLALVEFVLFLVISLELLRVIKIRMKSIVIGVVLFIVLFAAAELSRQFYVQYALSGADIDNNFAFQWTTERLYTYYSDPVNKFYLVLDHELFFRGMSFMDPITMIVRKFDPKFLMGGFDVQQYGVDTGFIFPDFNNVGAISRFFLDFGYFGAILYFIFFYLFSAIYCRAKRPDSFLSFSLYPAFVIGGMEFIRLFYFYDTRSIIPLTIFFFAVLLNQSMIRWKNAKKQ